MPDTIESTYERRSVELVDIRVGQDGDAPKIRGHAAVFGQPAEIGSLFGTYVEEIAPGAFTKTLREADVRALMNHNPDYVLGRSKAGTLKLAEDARGLAVEIDPPDTQWARDLMVSMQRGDISQMSFGFIPVHGKTERVDSKDGDSPPKFIRREVKLVDVSVVAIPAYPQTDAYVRSSIEALQRFLPSEPSADAHSATTRVEPPVSDEHSLASEGSRQEALPAQEAVAQPEPAAPLHPLGYYKALLSSIENP